MLGKPLNLLTWNYSSSPSPQEYYGWVMETPYLEHVMHWHSYDLKYIHIDVQSTHTRTCGHKQ